MPLLSEFSKDQIETIVESNPLLRGYMQGYLAEVKLMEQLGQTAFVQDVHKIPDASKIKADIGFTYRGLDFRIECKSILTSSVRVDVLNETWEGRVQVKNTDSRSIDIMDSSNRYKSNLPKSVVLPKGHFDILAISCYAVKGLWEFVFMENRHLPEYFQGQEGYIKPEFTVNPFVTPYLRLDLESILEETYQHKTAN